jgi:hypothetical protein
MISIHTSVSSTQFEYFLRANTLTMSAQWTFLISHPTQMAEIRIWYIVVHFMCDTAQGGGLPMYVNMLLI